MCEVAGVHVLCEMCPSLPVILVKGTLNEHNQELLHQFQIDISKLLPQYPLGWVQAQVLEIQIILAVFLDDATSSVILTFP